jgi:hypothetical protein
MPRSVRLVDETRDELLGEAPLGDSDDTGEDSGAGTAGATPVLGHDGGALALASLVLATGAMLLNLTSLRMPEIAVRYVSADGAPSELASYVATIVPGVLLLGPAAICALLALMRAPAHGWQRSAAGAALLVSGAVVLVLAVSVLALWGAPEVAQQPAF